MGYPIVITANCYNNEEEVIRFINTIERQSAVDEIYLAICVNKATNAKLISDHLDKSRLNGIVVDPENNLGYLHGCLYALERCKFDNYKWVVISNTDIEIDNIQYIYIIYCINIYFQDLSDSVTSNEYTGQSPPRNVGQK